LVEKGAKSGLNKALHLTVAAILVLRGVNVLCRRPRLLLSGSKGKSWMTQDFNLHDFRRQLDQVQKMGMKDLYGSLPGTSEMVPHDEEPEVALHRIRQIIDAMTDEERSNPDIIDSSRRSRIAASSCTQPNDVEQFLAQFDQVRALMRQMASMSLWQRVKMMGGFEKLPGQDREA
jgi:signal recognition particle GTPase